MSLSDETNEGLSISDILRGLLRRKMLITISALLGFALGCAFLLISKPRYLAEAQVIIENRATPFDKTVGPQDGSGTWQVSDHMVTSQVSAMRSDDIASRVVDQLSLDKNPLYNANLTKRGMMSRLAILLGFKDDPSLYTAKALAIKTLTSDVTIYPMPESNVIGIKSTAGEPSIAAAAANAIAETYVLTTREAGVSDTDRARDWLAKQIDDLRAKVTESDQAVERYRADAGLIRGTSATLTTQQISELNSQIGAAENARIEAQSKVDAIQSMMKSKGDVNSSSDVLASPALQRLKDEQIIAARDITQASAVYLPDHPKMIAAQRHLDAINNQIKVEAQRVVDSLKSQAQVANERSKALHAELDKLKSDQTKNSFSDVQLQALQRDAAATRTLLQSMLNRYADASARQDASLQPGFARIIQKAEAPAAPYFPKSGPTLLLSGLAGLLLGFGLAFIFEILSQPSLASAGQMRRDDPKARIPQYESVAVAPGASTITPLTSAAVKSRFDMNSFLTSTPLTRSSAITPKAVPPLPETFGTMPAAATATQAAAMLDVTAFGSPTSLTEQSKKLAECFEGFARDQAMKTFVFATIGSHAPNAAMIALATARALVAKGKRVMMVDLSSRPMSAESLLKIDQAPGIAELVAGKSDFTKSVTRDPQSKLHFVRLGEVADVAQEETIVRRLPAIITALRRVYDIVIFNVGDARASVVPVLANADITLLMAADAHLVEADSAAKAIEEGGTTKTLLVRLDTEPA
ncbi:MAG: exopolysaccharide transport family protein, partial [Aestuariivirga sp.]